MEETTQTPVLTTMQCDSVKNVAELKGDSAEYRLEPKYDGFRLIAHIDDEGCIHTYTRAGKEQTGKLPYIEKQLLQIFPPGTVIDGEIVAMKKLEDGKIDNDFEHVQSVMLSLPERAVQVAKDVRPLDYVVFDMMYIHGRDIRSDPMHVRRLKLRDQLAGSSLPHIAHAPWEKGGEGSIFLTPSWIAQQETHDDLVAKDFEGSIIKHVDSVYRSDGRGSGWYKLKATWEVDVVVTGFIPGSEGTAYEGKIGGIEFGQPEDAEKFGQMLLGDDDCMVAVTNRGSCSGFTLEMRNEISANRDEYIGKIMTIAHMGLMKDGVHFRHPQFKRWRPDKPLEELIWHDR